MGSYHTTDYSKSLKLYYKQILEAFYYLTLKKI